MLVVGRAPATGVVAGAGAFDLGHRRAEVGELHRREGPGQDPREVEDPQAVKSSGHTPPHYYLRVSKIEDSMYCVSIPSVKEAPKCPLPAALQDYLSIDSVLSDEETGHP